MIEIVFSANARGSLSVAQHIDNNTIGSAFAMIFSNEGEKLSKKETERITENKKKELENKYKNAAAIGGNREDIFLFEDDLSQGPLDSCSFKENRINYFLKYSDIFPFEAKEIINMIKEEEINFSILKKRAEKGEEIRIWASSVPFEYLGMCRILSKIKAEIFPMPKINIVFLPRIIEKEGLITEYMGWGDAASEEFSELLKFQKTCTPEILSMALCSWERVKKENLPLRAFINGRIQSVPIDFYDTFIKREIDEQKDEFNEAKVIGNVLGKYQLGIGDMWIALRIEEMIKEGKLIPLTERKNKDDPVYRRILKKA